MSAFSIHEALAFGLRETKKYFFALLPLSTLTLISMLLVSVGRFDPLRPVSIGVVTLSFAASFVLFLFLRLGMIRMVLDILDGKNPSFRRAVAVYGAVLPMLGALLLLLLPLGIGFFLFFIPGVFLWVIFSFSPFLIVDRGYGVLSSLAESVRLSKDVRSKLLLLTLILFAINLAGLLVFVVGVLATIPFSILAYGYCYRKMTGMKILQTNPASPALPVSVPPSTS